MFQRFLAIAVNTFLETLRQPIYGVILIATAVLLMLNVALAGFTLEDDDKLLLDVGLSTLLVSGLFLSSFSASAVLSREIENKTVLIVIAKPVNRPLFLVSKFFGLSLALVLAFYLTFLVFLLAQRHGVLENTADPWDAPALAFGFGSVILAFVAAGYCNYFYGSILPTTTIVFLTPLLTIAVLATAKLDKLWNVVPFGESFVGGQVILAAYLVFLNNLFVAAVAFAASTRTGQVVTLLFSTMVLGLGIVSDYAFGQHAAASGLASFAYHVLPNLGPFWVMDGLHAQSPDTTITAGYLLYTTGYAALWILATLAVSIALFERREVG